MSSESDNLGNFLSGSLAREALRVIERLSAAGFVAYFAGGCVRDALLNRKPKDFDVATNATPESVREVFGKKRTLAIGAAFGVIVVLPERSKLPERSNEPGGDETEPTEVATFRSDGDYSDGRRPDSVQFGSAKEDALRRDFTINGMFFDPQQSKVIDFVDGAQDLQARTIRTIGSATKRFDEDKLRMLRAVRFATTLGFSIERETHAAIKTHADEIAVVSGERVGAEMRRLLSSPNAFTGLKTLCDCGLARIILPELELQDTQDLATRLDRLSERNAESVLACLMIHQDAPLSKLGEIAERWKLSNEERRRAEVAIRCWRTVAEADQLPWSTVQPVLIDRDVAWIFNVANALVGESSAGVKLCYEALKWPAEKLNPTPILTGTDLQELGIPTGPNYARILAAVRRDQLDGKIKSQQQAFEFARSYSE